MNSAVAGGTGKVGRHGVSIAKESVYTVTSLSRGEGVDLMTGRGLDSALRGVDTVIDAVNIRSLPAKGSVDLFIATTTNLLRAGKTAGMRHTWRSPSWARTKQRLDTTPESWPGGTGQQRGRAWTILRATQFHDFAEQILRRSSVGPLAFVPRMATQPIAAREGGEAVVDAAEAGLQGWVADLGGPRVEQLVDMARGYARKSGGSGS